MRVYSEQRINMRSRQSFKLILKHIHNLMYHLTLTKVTLGEKIRMKLGVRCMGERNIR